MIIERLKLYQGRYIDLRDFEVKDAIRNNDKIIVVHNGERMTLTPFDLKSKKLLLNKEKIASKVYLGQYYYLYSYLWNPDAKISKEDRIREDCINYGL